MSDTRVPPPDFDGSRYERPNKDWVCGHACEGCPCRIGPSPDGECRATTECQPQLVVKDGEEKGTWKCTRPKEWGGPCVEGPLPDGTCCNLIPKCRPARSLRKRRGLVVRATIAASIGGLLIALAGPGRESFVNPAPISLQHTGTAFAKMAAIHGSFDGQGCVACHQEIKSNVSQWTSDALNAGLTSLSFAELISNHPRDFSRMDASCVACHQEQSFHQPNVARETSCSVCHREHQGGGRLPPVAGQNCTDCHGDSSQMAAAATKGSELPSAFFAKAVQPGQTVFARERPDEGFTRVIHSFAEDHPQFHVRQADVRDPDTLAFNHARHMEADIPLLNGKPLECASCHQPDATGGYMRRVSFEQNCRACHSLQFDENNPAMQLPHGDSAYVRAYLRSLPAQYADYGTHHLGLVAKGELDRYVAQQMNSLRERGMTGESLEEQVFFSGAHQAPAPGVIASGGQSRAKFAGCAYCHEVTARRNAAPVVTPPVIPDRWMPHARFNHASHTQVTCASCHVGAIKSRLTSDIILPTQQSCVECHGPKGGVNASCTECHKYHNTPPAAWRNASSQ